MEERFRNIYEYAIENGYGAGFPNFHQAEYPDLGLVYGTVFIKPEAIVGPVHVPSSELGNPSNYEERFRAIYDYAIRNGYGGGFPNFHQAEYPNLGLVYGTVFIKPEAIVGPVHVPVSKLKLDPDVGTVTGTINVPHNIIENITNIIKNNLNISLGNQGYIRIETCNIHGTIVDIKVLIRYKHEVLGVTVQASAFIEGNIDLINPKPDGIRLCKPIPREFGEPELCINLDDIIKILRTIL